LNIVSHLQGLPLQFPGVAALSSHAVNLMGCRSFDQFCCTARGLQDPEQFCPFCQSEMRRRGRKADFEKGHWLLIKNEFPHKNTRQMYLVIPRQHIVSLSELSTSDWLDLANLIEKCARQYHIEGGGIMWRFGDARFNAGTVEHLHINIIEPIPGKEYRPPFAKNEPEHSEDYARLTKFVAELGQKGGEEWLFSPQGIEETQPKVA